MRARFAARLPIVAATGLAREARIASGAGVRAVASGGDADYLAFALEREAENGASAIISFGIAGALRADLAAGTLLVGRSIVASTTRWRCDDAWTLELCERLPGALLVDMVGVDAVVTGPEAKCALLVATNAAAIDMESHIAARIAAAHRLPFAALRVVADAADRSLPSAAMVALAPGGKLRYGAVVRAISRRPSELPLLVRTALATRAALRALSRGSRRLGPGLGYPNLRELALDVS